MSRFYGGNRLGDILELAYIARPAVFAQQYGRFFSEHSLRHTVTVGEVRGKFAEQQVYVSGSLPEGRHHYGHCIQTIEQIFPELAFGNGVHQVDICCRHNSHIGFQHFG